MIHHKNRVMLFQLKSQILHFSVGLSVDYSGFDFSLRGRKCKMNSKIIKS